MTELLHLEIVCFKPSTMSLNEAQIDILEAVREEYKTADDDRRKAILKSTLRSLIHLEGKRTADVSDNEKQEMFMVGLLYSTGEASLIALMTS
jgi:uncharacterized protein YbgA (DUF1722 family)